MKSQINTTLYSQVIELLEQIEAELKGAQLWTLVTPDAEAMKSTAPFFFDTMPLEHWLQFVFLPRMRFLVDNQLVLPQQIAVCPMAEEAFQGRKNTETLINRIADLDELLSGQREQTTARG